MGHNHRAVPYTKEIKGGLQCLLCPHVCRLKEGQTGRCKVRQITAGVLEARNYRLVAAMAMDPIEKKPLYHFYPGSYILSVGSVGCNFSCGYCQNWTLSSCLSPTRRIDPEWLVERAGREESLGIAFTYAEPLMWYETLTEILPKGKEKNLQMVLVTNGYLNPRPLKAILPFIDGVNMDLKTFKADTYREFCGGELKAVLRNALLFKKQAHLELTTLVIPGINDRPDEVEALARWVGEELGPETPLHLTRYFPAYKFDRPPTPLDRLQELYGVAREILHYVYLGNISCRTTNNTHCPGCGEPVIKRNHRVEINLGKGNACPECGRPINLKYIKE